MSTNVVEVTRSHAIVDAWNEGRVADIGMSETVSLIGFAPKTSPRREAAALNGRTAVEERFAAFRMRHPRFDLVSALENDRSLSMVLRDQDGHQVTVALELDEDGLIARIVSFRAV